MTRTDPEITPTFELEIADREWSHPDCARLRQLQQEEIVETYDGNNTEPGIPPSASDITLFVVAYLRRQTDDPTPTATIPIACGGLRALSDDGDAPGEVELKRMFVLQDYRGRPWSAAKAILAALEEKARQRGWKRVVLETGDRLVGAHRFYRREGYVPIPKFGAYVSSRHSACFMKVLEEDV